MEGEIANPRGYIFNNGVWNYSVYSFDFIAECWISEPSERPTFKELVQTIDTHLNKIADYLALT